MAISAESLKEQSEALKQATATLIDREILKLPEGTSSGTSRRLVDGIVSILLIEVSLLMVQSREQIKKD